MKVAVAVVLALGLAVPVASAKRVKGPGKKNVTQTSKADGKASRRVTRGKETGHQRLARTSAGEARRVTYTVQTGHGLSSYSIRTSNTGIGLSAFQAAVLIARPGGGLRGVEADGGRSLEKMKSYRAEVRFPDGVSSYRIHAESPQDAYTAVEAAARMAGDGTPRRISIDGKSDYPGLQPHSFLVRGSTGVTSYRVNARSEELARVALEAAARFSPDGFRYIESR